MLKYFYIEGVNSNMKIECAVINNGIMLGQESKIKFALKRAGYTGVLAYAFDDSEVMAHAAFLDSMHSENIIKAVSRLSPFIELNQPKITELFNWALQESRDEFDASRFGIGGEQDV